AIGNQTVNRIAMWDGDAWHPLTGPNGTGVSGDALARVRAILVHDDGSGPAVYVAGRFGSAAGVQAFGIARWDGAEWSPLSGPSGNGFNDEVYDLVVFDDGNGPKLYAGGAFTTAGGQPANRVAKWDGSAWSPVGSGMNSRVQALADFDDGGGPALYAGGTFIVAGGQAANRIAKWDGTAWSPLGSNGLSSPAPSYTVLSLAVADDGTGPALYVGGSFIFADGLLVNRLARWDGAAWSALGLGLSGGNVTEIVPFNTGSGPGLAVGGSFNGITSGDPAPRVALYTAADGWQALDPGDASPLNGTVSALATTPGSADTPSTLIIGGAFTTSPSGAARITAWRGCFVPETPCPADLTGPALDGIPDGLVGVADLNFYITLWINGDPAADLTGPALDGIPDGLVGVADLNYYIALWIDGCP
ncbi:MAG: hypothetical protein EA378_01290, partial [Phycisphaerales bacterium]